MQEDSTDCLNHAANAYGLVYLLVTLSDRRYTKSFSRAAIVAISRIFVVSITPATFIGVA